VERDAEARKLLRESGFEVEDFPDYLKADPTLIGYARRLPQELRAEYLRAPARLTQRLVPRRRIS
jgi:hypothetical protein